MQVHSYTVTIHLLLNFLFQCTGRNTALFKCSLILATSCFSLIPQLTQHYSKEFTKLKQVVVVVVGIRLCHKIETDTRMMIILLIKVYFNESIRTYF